MESIWRGPCHTLASIEPALRASGVLQRDKLATARQRDRFLETPLPSFADHITCFSQPTFCAKHLALSRVVLWDCATI